MRTVADISNQTGLSRQAVYKRLKNPLYNQFITHVDKVAYLTDEGFALAFADYNQGEQLTVLPTDEQPVESDAVKELYEALINQQSAELKRLHDELNYKNEHITNLTRMLDQAQQLQLHLQDQVLLKAPMEEQKPSVWGKLFGLRSV